MSTFSIMDQISEKKKPDAKVKMKGREELLLRGMLVSHVRRDMQYWNRGTSGVRNWKAPPYLMDQIIGLRNHAATTVVKIQALGKPVRR